MTVSRQRLGGVYRREQKEQGRFWWFQGVSAEYQDISGVGASVVYSFRRHCREFQWVFDGFEDVTGAFPMISEDLKCFTWGLRRFYGENFCGTSGTFNGFQI